MTGEPVDEAAVGWRLSAGLKSSRVGSGIQPNQLQLGARTSDAEEIIIGSAEAWNPRRKMRLYLNLIQRKAEKLI